jgi:hypothetical protein
MAYLKDKGGNEKVGVEEYDMATNAHHDIEHSKYVRMPFREFVEKLEHNTPGPEKRYLLGEWDLMARHHTTGKVSKTLHALHRDYPFPFLVDKIRLPAHSLEGEVGGGGGLETLHTRLFMGRSSPIQIHYHGDSDAVLFQVHSSKHVLLLPPNASADVGAKPDLPFCTFGPGGLEDGPDARTSDRLAKHPDALSVDLAPGDALYIPWLWWHATWAETDQISVALTHFWIDPEKHNSDQLHQLGHKEIIACLEKAGQKWVKDTQKCGVLP